MRYPEVCTALRLISIPTILFELRCFEINDTDNEIEDGFHCHLISNLIHSHKKFSPMEKISYQ